MSIINFNPQKQHIFSISIKTTNSTQSNTNKHQQHQSHLYQTFSRNCIITCQIIIQGSYNYQIKAWKQRGMSQCINNQSLNYPPTLMMYIFLILGLSWTMLEMVPIMTIILAKKKKMPLMMKQLTKKSRFLNLKI